MTDDELNGHVETATQCCDYLCHEVDVGNDPSGKMQDFADSLRVVLEQLSSTQHRLREREEEVERLRKECLAARRTSDAYISDLAEARAERAGVEGELLGLRVTAGFFEKRCEVLEAATKRKLTKTEQDTLAGCCPFCGVTVGEYVQEATKRIEAERDSALAAAQEAATRGVAAGKLVGEAELERIRELLAAEVARSHRYVTALDDACDLAESAIGQIEASDDGMRSNIYNANQQLAELRRVGRENK